ncbi:MAG: sulfatase-like hydrolase/transferase [Planctomycetota bacterium]
MTELCFPVRTSVKFALLVLALVLVCPLASGEIETGRDTQPPNVVFIITDDMMPWMFNFLNDGSNRVLTPNIDRLAAEGTVMMGQHVVSPVCTPSRYNCLTGRYSSRATSQQFARDTKSAGQTVVQWNTFIVPGEDCLPQSLQQAGYTTGMVGKNHVVEVGGLNKPEWESNPRDPGVKGVLLDNARIVENAVKASGFDYAENLYHNNPAHNGVRELAVHNMDWITSAGLDFIDQNADQPFFLYFATTIPHGPQADAYAWNADPTATAEGYLDQPLDVLPPRDSIPERLEKAGLQAGGNVGNVLWLDDAVGAIMDRLEKHGIDDNTIVVFFNDHGQMAKGTVYQGGVHNPSIVWKKAPFSAGPLNETLVSNIDFAPTILDWCGVDYEVEDFDGRSFASVLEGDRKEIHSSLYFELGYLRGVRKGDLKYVALRYPPDALSLSLEERQRRLDRLNKDLVRRGRPIITTDPNAPFSQLQLIPGGGDAENRSTRMYPAYHDADQLYDLSNDPGEQFNLAMRPQWKDALAEMKAELQAHLADLPGDFAELKRNPK